MDYSLVKDFLADFSLPTVIIALSVTVICFFVEKIFKDKVPYFFSVQLPFILAVAITLSIDMLFISRAFVLRKQTLISGILCGSLSIIFKRAVSNFKSGKSVFNLQGEILLIEELLKGVIDDEAIKATALAIKSLIDCADHNVEKEQINSQIIEVIYENLNKPLTEEEIRKLSILILQSISSLTK